MRIASQWRGIFPSPRDFSARARTTQVKVDALFLHHRNNLGMDPVAKALCRRQSSRLGWISQLVKERRGHL
jgi:hypothetical protein